MSSQVPIGERRWSILATAPAIGVLYKHIMCRIDPPCRDVGELCMEILHNTSFMEMLKRINFSEYCRVQVSFSIISEKMEEDGTLTESTAGIRTHPYFFEDFTDMEFWKEVTDGIISRFEKLTQAGSGWTPKRIEAVDFHLFKNERLSKALGSYVPYPKKVGGVQSIINIESSTNNCVEFALLAYFHHAKIADKDKNKEASYLPFRNKTFIFPPFEDNIVKYEDFVKIENITDTSIFVYSLSLDSNRKYNIRISRRGKNSKSSNIVHLLLLEDKHIALIHKFDHFMQNVRHGKSGLDYKNFKYCHICLSKIKKKRFKHHLKLCTSKDGIQNIIAPPPNSKKHFRELNALVKAPFVGYFDFESKLVEDDNHVSQHQLISYLFIIINEEQEIVAVNRGTGGDPRKLATSMLEHILNRTDSIMKQYAKSWESRPLLTFEDKKKHNAAKKCQVCDKKFSEIIRKHAHHSWSQKVEYDSDGKLIVGNYVAPLCFSCNRLITEKRYAIPFLSHNFGGYDSHMLIQGITKAMTCTLTSKSSENIMGLDLKYINGVYGVKFIDSLNFLKAPLDTLVTNLKDIGHDFKFTKSSLKRKQYSPELINLSIRKGFFPYEYLDSDDKLNVDCLPPKEDFFSNLKNTGISDEDYAHAQNIYRLANCTNFRMYLEYYLLLDVLLLAECFQYFRLQMYSNYNLDPVYFLTLPSFTYEAALHSSKCEIDLLSDVEVITLIESNIRGGLVSVCQGSAHFNNPSLPNYNPNSPITSGIYLDFNSLYAHALSRYLPYKCFYELTDEEVKVFQFDSINPDGEYYYMFLIDFTIPDDVKRRTDQLPLGINHVTLPNKDLSQFTSDLMKATGTKKISEKLLATHHDQTDYLIGMMLLKLYIELGVKITKVSRIFRFKQAPIFKDYIDKNVDFRKNSTNSVDKGFFKLLNNSLFGKTLTNVRNYSKNLRLVKSRVEFLKAATDPLLLDCHRINSDLLLMRVLRETVKLSFPSYIGFAVLDYAKYSLYSYFHKDLRNEFGNDVNLIYTDTDSFILSFKGMDILQNIDRLQPFLDTSNFPVNNVNYDNSNKGRLGLLKSELGDTPMESVIALSPKCYAVKAVNKDFNVNRAKGVPRKHKIMSNYEYYKEIHEGVKSHHTINFQRIQSKKNRLFTLNVKKHVMSKIDTKRYWINSEESLGFGHPDIPVNEEDQSPYESTSHVDEEEQDHPRRLPHGFRPREIVNQNFILNYKKTRPGRELYDCQS